MEMVKKYQIYQLMFQKFLVLIMLELLEKVVQHMVLI